MPEGQAIVDWITSHLVAVIFWTVLLLVVLRFSGPIVHRVLVRVIRPPTVSADTGIDEEAEVAKRVATLEDLFSKIIRFAVFIAFVRPAALPVRRVVGAGGPRPPRGRPDPRRSEHRARLPDRHPAAG
jgi:hypothetical protein